MALYLSIVTLEVRRLRKNAFIIPRENYFQPRFLFLATLLKKYEDKIKAFSNMQNTKKFTFDVPFLEKPLEDSP